MGTEKAFDLLSKVVEARGRVDGKALAERLGVVGGGIDAGLLVYEAFLTDCGVDHQVVERSDERALIRVGKCPFYDAYHSAVLDCDWLAERMCRSLIHPLITTILREVNPGLSSMVRRYRFFSGGYCLEEIALKRRCD